MFSMCCISLTNITSFILFTSFILYILKKYWRHSYCKSNARLDGKVAIVTGANSGIGFETAKDFARRGGHVILACRNVKSGEDAAQEISQVTCNQNVFVKQLDLASLRSVRQFSADIKQNYPKIDILINNAGVGGIPFTKTEDGFETTMASNYIGHFLLTNLLLEPIIAAAPSRIVNVSALAHWMAKIDWNDFMMEKNYSSIRAYCNSKLANILFTRELAKRLSDANTVKSPLKPVITDLCADTGVSVYSLHPGVIKTNFGRHFKVMNYLVVKWLYSFVSSIFFKTAEQGAQTTIHCAVSEEASQETGLYYGECAVVTPSSQALDADAMQRLWSLSEELVGLDDDIPSHNN